MRHRRSAHGKSEIKCRYKAENKCKFVENNGEECLYDHLDTIQATPTHNDLKCNTCGDTFNFKSAFLKHRKNEHPATVPECKTIREGKNCPFGDQCGFSHEVQMNHHMTNKHVASQVSDINESNASPSTQTNLWESRRAKNPPDQMEEIKRLLQTMMVDICQLKEQQKKTAKN